jgi:Ca2+:H+ antiporter
LPKGAEVNPLLKEIRHNPLLWLLALVPVVLIAAKLVPDAHTLLFVLSVLAIVPLAGLLSHATESVAEKTGDAAGGLLNATLGNLTELVIAAAALRAGEYALVKGSIAGAIVTNTLFMLGASFLLGGLKHHLQSTIALPPVCTQLCSFSLRLRSSVLRQSPKLTCCRVLL